jgi:hypothetical protein
MENIDEGLDRKACEILASRLTESTLLRDMIAYNDLSQVEGREGIVSRNLGGLCVIVYDKKHRKDYENELAKARAFHLTRGLPIAKNFLYELLEHGIKQDARYMILRYKTLKRKDENPEREARGEKKARAGLPL